MALQIRGVHHIVLTVANPNKSAAFYEKILGVKASRENPQVRWISCRNFLLCFQRPPKQAIPNDRFDENRVGLDHVGFAVESHQQLHELLVVLGEKDHAYYRKYQLRNKPIICVGANCSTKTRMIDEWKSAPFESLSPLKQKKRRRNSANA